MHDAGVLGGLVGGPRAYQDQFRGFEPHRVHIVRVGTFSWGRSDDICDHGLSKRRPLRVKPYY